jgi:tetratricopeptide (TPR) repeat protein
MGKMAGMQQMLVSFIENNWLLQLIEKHPLLMALVVGISGLLVRLGKTLWEQHKEREDFNGFSVFESVIKEGTRFAWYQLKCADDKTLKELLSIETAVSPQVAEKADSEHLERGKDLNAESKTSEANRAFSQGNAHYQKGNIDQAIEDWNDALNIKPDYVWAYNNRAGAYARKSEWDKAINDCNEALRLMPDCAEFYSNRGEVYLYKGNWDKAIEDCTKALEFKPHLAEAYYYRGEAYSGKGEWDKAIADWEECLRIDQNNKSAQANLDKARKEGKMKGTENQEDVLTDIEKKFEEEFDATTREYEKICGVVATRIHEMVARYGRRETAERLMNNPDLQFGFKALRDAGRLNISSEALVIRYKKLFSPNAVEVAQWRLDHPYDLLEGK